MSDVEIEALKPFGKTARGDMVHPGDPPFMVGESRAGELERMGLARRTGKAASEPANKMAPEAENKSADAKPLAITDRRSPAKLSGRG